MAVLMEVVVVVTVGAAVVGEADGLPGFTVGPRVVGAGEVGGLVSPGASGVDTGVSPAAGASVGSSAGISSPGGLGAGVSPGARGASVAIGSAGVVSGGPGTSGAGLSGAGFSGDGSGGCGGMGTLLSGGGLGVSIGLFRGGSFRGGSLKGSVGLGVGSATVG